SVFVSRIDTEIDARLDAIGTPQALALRGRAAVANARLAYQRYEQMAEDSRWPRLADGGARAQRPLWASTGVKNPAYPDTMYVTELVAPGTVSTIPQATLEAVADHGVITGDTMTGTAAQALEVFERLRGGGIDLPNLFAVLEHDGVGKFAASWLRPIKR